MDNKYIANGFVEFFKSGIMEDEAEQAIKTLKLA